jgi:hypothetical protein
MVAMELLRFLDVTWVQLLVVLVVALAVGMNKAGLSGITLVTIPLMAAVWGGRQSTGLMLLMLIIGDMFASGLTTGACAGTRFRSLLRPRRRNRRRCPDRARIDDRQFKI